MGNERDDDWAGRFFFVIKNLIQINLISRDTDLAAAAGTVAGAARVGVARVSRLITIYARQGGTATKVRERRVFCA